MTALQMHMRIMPVLTLMVLLAGCSSASSPATPVPSDETPIVLLRDLHFNAPLPAEPVTVSGYLLINTHGAALVDSVVFEPNEPPRATEDNIPAIWLGANIPAEMQSMMPRQGDAQYAIVAAHGHITGPGSFGPDEHFRYQMVPAQLKVLVAQNLSIPALLDGSARYSNQLVHVAGGLLVRDGSALLVERIGSGGLPQPKARLIKLSAPVVDSALLAMLNGTPGSAVRFGQVQIEGVWRNGVLTPLSFTPIM